MYRNPHRMDHIFKDDLPIPINPNALKHPDSFGVEVELEGAGVDGAGAEILSMWVPHLDHSLRNHYGPAIEYVFKKPYSMLDTVAAINILFGFLNSPKVKVAESYRTSIHVHLNFAMETYRTIYNFMTLCMILDELLVSQNGDHRIGNNFCLRARDAMGQANSLTKSVMSGNEIFGINQNERYSSINFVSLLKFGSIEFRSLECTTDKGRLMHWINTLDHMKKVSREFRDPVDVISKFSNMGVKDFLFMVLGPYAIKYSLVPGFEGMLHSGMRIAQDFAYCSEWKPMKVGDQPKKTNKKVAYKPQFEYAIPQLIDNYNPQNLVQQAINAMPPGQHAPQPVHHIDDYDEPEPGDHDFEFDDPDQ